MEKVWGKTKGVSREERVGIWPSYMLLSVSLLVYICALAVPGSVKAKDINVAAGNVYNPGGLLEAINEANSTEESDNIILAPGSYFLTRSADTGANSLNGLPSIRHELSISCPTNAIIQKSGAGEFRIFHIGEPESESRTEPVTLSNITIRGGRILNGEGGGLFIDARIVTLINCTVSDNSANKGGGIFNDVGVVTLDKCTISGNRASDGGGGFFTLKGFVTILNSTISENKVVDNNADGGGGFFTEDATVTMENCTVNDNSLTSFAGFNGVIGGGGGIRNVSGGKLTITNSTISGNKLTFNGRGGGIFSDATLDLNNVTITKNTAGGSGEGTPGSGGGIFASHGGTATVKNTIIAENVAGSFAPDCQGELNSQGFNLFGKSSPSFTLIGGTNDQIGTNDDPIDPKLGPLQDNGGFTMTHALIGGSPALNTGNSAIPGSGDNACSGTDQRGFRRFPQLTSACDIGAFELGWSNLNNSFSETRSKPITSDNTTGCQGLVGGQLSFVVRFQNLTDSSIFEFVVEVEKLTNGNLLQNADGGPGGAGARLTINEIVLPRGFVDVPFIICLRDKNPFSFFVDVFGIED